MKRRTVQTLWTRNFTLVTAATALGAIGGIAGNFALSFLVFDETGSTLASALIAAIQLIPSFLIPLLTAPFMDRLPRKPFLVGGDLLNGILYISAGIYLSRYHFSYIGYLFFSLLLSSLSSFDELAYNSIYPKLIPAGLEEKGYTVSSMLYPILNVTMMPVAALLFEHLGVAAILMGQGCLSLVAAVTEAQIQIREEIRITEEPFSLRLWLSDTQEAIHYLRQEKGLQSIYTYMAVTNGVASGYAPLLVAFFRTAPGFTAGMYSLFSVAEFAGRTLGGILHYRSKIPNEKKFSIAFWIYQAYETMDMCLLWIPYPLMLANRAAAGFLGINSAAMREAAVQRYIPESLRARINAFESMLFMASASVLSLIVGALGEVLDYRLCVTLAAGFTLVVCWLTIWRHRKAIRQIYTPAQ